MTPELWAKVNAVFDRLDPLSEADRRDELGRLRAADPTLAAEVASLLQPAASVGAKLDRAVTQAWQAAPLPSATADPDAEPPAVPGCRLDGGADNVRYGGMGVVHFGIERGLRRPVAVKVLRRRLAADPALVARFRDECLIAAQLQHPGIVPVHAVGELADGRPYCVMKLVRGETFADVLKRRPVPAADLIPNLLIFRRVCEALAYAHGKGVIHRDLKPGNVMVGAHDEVLLVDWGLAKKLDAPADAEPESRAVLVDTRTGDLETKSGLGSLPYLAPEQANGLTAEVDERSDVFGLGAVLCVVLTGRPPYAGPTDAAVERKALRADLGEAFDRLDVCGADADLVALAKRCLATGRADRPADAGVVARLVADYLNGVEERRRQAEVEKVRAETEAREQRKRRRVQLALAATLGVLIVGGGLAAWWEDRRASRRQADESLRKQEETERALRGADAVNRLVAAGEEALRAGEADQAQAAMTEAVARLQDGGGGSAAPRLAQVRRDLAVLRELDDIDRLRWAPDGGRMPSPKTLAGLWKTAFQHFGIEPGQTPPDESARLLAASAVRERLLGALDLWLSRDPTPEVGAILTAADGDSYREEVRAAITAQVGGNLAKFAELGVALRQPARFAAVLGQLPAVPPQRRREILEVALQARHRDLSLLMTIGQLYCISRPDTADARSRWYQAAVTAHPRSVAARHGLGLALWDKGEFDGAVRESRVAVGLDPAFVPGHNCLGLGLEGQGKWEAAAPEYREAIRLDPDFPQPHANLGNILARSNVDAAIREYQEALRIDPKFAVARYSLGNMLLSKNDVDGAIEEYNRAIEADPQYAAVYNSLGNVLQSKGDLEGASREYARAIQSDPKFPRPHYNWGNVLARQGKPAAAVREYQAATAIDPQAPLPYFGLGNVLATTGDPEGAIRAYREAVRLKVHLADAYTRLAGLLAKRGEAYAALEVLRTGLGQNHQFQDAFRYRLATVSVLVAAGQARDAPPDVDAPALRRVALKGLTGELDALRKAADNGNRTAAHDATLRWLGDADLAAVRDENRLPPAERPAWAELWRNVRRLGDATAPRPVAPRPREVSRPPAAGR